MSFACHPISVRCQADSEGSVLCASGITEDHHIVCSWSISLGDGQKGALRTQCYCQHHHSKNWDCDAHGKASWSLICRCCSTDPADRAVKHLAAATPVQSVRHAQANRKSACT